MRQQSIRLVLQLCCGLLSFNTVRVLHARRQKGITMGEVIKLSILLQLNSVGGEVLESNQTSTPDEVWRSLWCPLPKLALNPQYFPYVWGKCFLIETYMSDEDEDLTFR